jgi:hypothetical protein
MQNENAYIGDNALGRGPMRTSPTTWPPPWLIKAREIAKANPLPPQAPEPPELAAWDDIDVVETGEPCPKCGSLEKWWDFNNKVHCQQCEPIRRAIALADLAARIRSRKP